MPTIMNLHARKRRRSASPEAWAGSRPIDTIDLREARRQKVREALQEAVFALQITHAQTCTVIEQIENPESRGQLQTQSMRIGSLIDLAWCRLGDI